MAFYPPPSDSDAVDHGDETPITALHGDILLTQILNRLDGRVLASACCASTELNSLCSDDGLWRDICNSTWPSTAKATVSAAVSTFPSGHRSFYSDVFPALRHYQSWQIHHQRPTAPPELISAVDICYNGRLIYSKVLVTETRSTWFQNTPFRLNLLDPGETLACGDALETRAGERMKVSWILIDPISNRAANMASEKAVEVRCPWVVEDAQFRYSTVMSDSGGELVQSLVVAGITCGGKGGRELHVREMSLQVEDLDGRILTGSESLGILLDAMRGGRRKRDGETEEECEIFSMMKERRRQGRMKREKEWDTAVMAAGVSGFLAGFIWFWSQWG